MAGRHVRDQWTSYVCAKNSGRFRREQHHILCPILAQLSWQQIFCQRDTWKRKDTTKSIVTRAICVANYTSLNFGRKIEMIAAFRVCMRYALRIRLLDVHATFVEYFFFFYFLNVCYCDIRCLIVVHVHRWKSIWILIKSCLYAKSTTKSTNSRSSYSEACYMGADSVMSEHTINQSNLVVCNWFIALMPLLTIILCKRQHDGV